VAVVVDEAAFPDSSDALVGVPRACRIHLAQQQREVVASVHARGQSLLRPLKLADCPAPIVAVRMWQRVKNSRACEKCCA
jgi:hypothetical protein